MRVLIAGALGHIGSGLIDYLLKNTDYSVFAIDNLKTQRYSTLLGIESGAKFFLHSKTSPQMMKISP